MSAQPERFATALLVLLAAVDNLEQGDQSCCAPGHLIAAANGFTVECTINEEDFSNAYRWQPADQGASWMWYSSLNNWRMEHRKGSRQPHAHIITAGFSFEELDKLDLAFERAPTLSAGLLATVAMLGEIFNIHPDVIASAQARFT